MSEKGLVLEATEHYARAVEAVWNSVWSCDSSDLARTKMKKPGAEQGARSLLTSKRSDGARVKT